LHGLTSKEATRIEEGLHIEQTLMNKYDALAVQAADPASRQLLQDLQALHQRHYGMLLSQVNAAAQGTAAAVQPTTGPLSPRQHQGGQLEGQTTTIATGQWAGQVGYPASGP